MKQEYVAALVRAHYDQDAERFRGLVLSIAANAAASSPKFAQQLRQIVDRRPMHGEFIQLPADTAKLFSASTPTITLDSMIVDPRVRAQLDTVLSEHSARERLFVYGLEPMRKLLFAGPPGVGKTMAASAIAGALKLPLMRVRLEGVITSHLGETGANLSKVFDHVRMQRAVYLFDEFDALAIARDDTTRHDVGEMRRVVASLLQFVETDDSTSILIATTNLVSLLDRAFHRRFDAIVPFELPADAEREALLRRTLLYAPADLTFEVEHAAGLSHADILAACYRTNKVAVLANSEAYNVAALEAELCRVMRTEGAMNAA
jgi:SpoVK/Ycf46/Vps4 family AAA+-type ATPase